MVHIHTQRIVGMLDYQVGATTQTSATHKTSTVDLFSSVHLRGRRSLSVAREDFQSDPPAAVFEHLLQLSGIVADVLPVHLFDDVAHMEQTLPVNHAPVEDSSDDQVVFLHSKRHTLRSSSSAGVQCSRKVRRSHFQIFMAGPVLHTHLQSTLAPAHQWLAGFLSDSDHAHGIGLHESIVHCCIVARLCQGRDFITL